LFFVERGPYYQGQDRTVLPTVIRAVTADGRELWTYSMPSDAGMLFVFDPPANAKQVGFWMKDTLIPLSIAFVEPSLSIEDIQDMQPQTEQPHYAPRDYVYAIEANLGFFANHGVAVGDKVTIQR